MTIDYFILLMKIGCSFFVLRSKFERNDLARFNRFSIMFYLSGLFKLLLIDLAFLSGGILISIPIYALTLIYLFSTLVFLPILRVLLATVDAAHSKLILKER